MASLKSKKSTQVNGKHGEKREETIEVAVSYDQRASKVIESAIYKFDHNVRTSEHIKITPDALSIEGYQKAIAINQPSEFKDYL